VSFLASVFSCFTGVFEKNGAQNVVFDGQMMVKGVADMDKKTSLFNDRKFCSFINFIFVSSFVLVCVTGHAQNHHIKIRVINAKTNQPIPDERLNVALRVDQIGSVAMGTDKNGIIDVDAGQATIIRILSNMYADCRPRSELYTNYSLDTIRQSGITTGNLCSNASLKAKPGELLLFEVPKTFVPTFPKPPVSSLPHSDENPH
jgi:hypothetical protein